MSLHRHKTGGVAWIAILLCLPLGLLSWWAGRAGWIGGLPSAVPRISMQSRAAAAGEAEAVVSEGAGPVVAAVWEKLRHHRGGQAVGFIGTLLSRGQLAGWTRELSRDEWDRLADLIRRHPDALETDTLKALLEGVLWERHPEMAFDLEMELGREPGSPFGRNAVYRLSGSDPQAALRRWNAAAAQNPKPEWARPEMLRSIFENWSMTDAAAATAAVATVPDGEGRRQSETGLASQVMRFDLASEPPHPPDAWELSRSLLKKADRNYESIVTSTVGNLISKEKSVFAPAKTLQWFDSLEFASGQRELMAGFVAKGWAAEAMNWRWRDQTPAWNWLIRQVPPEARAQAMDWAVATWCASGDDSVIAFGRPESEPPDVAACADWLNSQGLGSDSHPAMSRLARAWVERQEPEAALAWVRAIPPGPGRKAAEAAVQAEIRRYYPGASFRLSDGAASAAPEASPP